MNTPVTLDSRGWNTANGYGTLSAPEPMDTEESPLLDVFLKVATRVLLVVLGVLLAVVIVAQLILSVSPAPEVPFVEQQLPTLVTE